MGFYDALIGMDWLEKYKAKVDCYNNIVECVYEGEEERLIKAKEYFGQSQLGKFLPCS